MPTYLFYKVVFLSLGAGAVIPALWALCRRGGKWLTCRWRYYIWLLPMALLLLPVTLPRFSAAPAAYRGGGVLTAPVQTQETPGPPAAESAPLTAGLAQAPAAGEAGPPHTAPRRSAPPPVLPLLWLAGIAALCCRHMIQAALVRRFLRRCTSPAGAEDLALLERLRRELGVRGGVALRRFPGRGSPFLCGLLKPVICLPGVPLDDGELRRVLAHELTHHRRRDLLVKRAARAVRTLHWFNPLVWLMERQVDRYCELSCDEAVVRGLDKKERQSYGLTILKLMREEKGRPPECAYLAEREIRDRMEVIMKRHHSGAPRKGLAAALAAVLCLGCTALAADVNGRNPNRDNGVAYRTEEFTEVWYSRDELISTSDPAAGYVPGTGMANAASGSARLVGLPGGESFSADLPAVRLNTTAGGRVYQSAPAHFQVEMTELHSAVETAGTWTGLFTVRRDGEVLFENTPGRVSGVPSLDGRRLTELFVVKSYGNWFRLTMNFGVTGGEQVAADAADFAAEQSLKQAADTRTLGLAWPDGGALNGESLEKDSFPFQQGAALYLNEAGEKAMLVCNLYTEEQPWARVDGETGEVHQDNNFKGYLLKLDPEDVISYENGVLKGVFQFQDTLYDDDGQFTGTLTGLDGGGRAVLRSDDGLTDIAFRYQENQTPQEPNIIVTGSDGGLSIIHQAPVSFRGEATLPEETFQALAAAGDLTQSEKISLADLPFSLSWTGEGLTLAYTGPEGWHWTAVLCNTAGLVRLRPGLRGVDAPEPPGAYDFRVTDADAREGVATLPFADENADHYRLFLAVYSTRKGAASAEYDLELFRGAGSVIPLSCQLERGIVNPEIPAGTAPAFLQMFMNKWVFAD